MYSGVSSLTLDWAILMYPEASSKDESCHSPQLCFLLWCLGKKQKMQPSQETTETKIFFPKLSPLIGHKRLQPCHSLSHFLHHAFLSPNGLLPSRQDFSTKAESEGTSTISGF